MRVKKLYQDEKSKECGTCHEIKLLCDFAYKKGKPLFRCKECHNAWYRAYFSKNENMAKQTARAKRRKNELGPVAFRVRQHGLTESEYYEMLGKYEGRCWICKSENATVIDHDHSCCKGSTGCRNCVRGVLCSPCNTMLGQADDDKNKLLRAVDYLRDNKRYLFYASIVDRMKVTNEYE